MNNEHDLDKIINLYPEFEWSKHRKDNPYLIGLQSNPNIRIELFYNPLETFSTTIYAISHSFYVFKSFKVIETNPEKAMIVAMNNISLEIEDKIAMYTSMLDKLKKNEQKRIQKADKL